MRLDVANLLRALRLRVEHRLAPEEVLGYAIRGGHLAATQRAALAYEPVETWHLHLAATPYAAALAEVETPWKLERELARVVVRTARRALSGPPFQIGLVLAWLVLVETQAADLRRVLEAGRLGRSEDWIRSGLVAQAGT
jgi:vacuolar-type H+-ATPase subunit C/Vma6